MIKLELSFIQLLKSFILRNELIGKYYSRKYGNSKLSLDYILEKILFILKTGISWRYIHSHWETIYWHFRRFITNHIFSDLFHFLRNKYIKLIKPSIQLIDTTFILNKLGHSCIARNKLFKNKNCNKISAITDVNGIPLSVLFNSGNVHDLSFLNGHFSDLIIVNKKYIHTNIKLLADKGYTSYSKKLLSKKFNYNLIVPPKSNMKQQKFYYKKLYKKRIFVEHFFQKLKLFRRIMIRYDKLISSFETFTFMATSFIIFRKLNQ